MIKWRKGCWSCSWIIQKTTGEFKRDFGKKTAQLCCQHPFVQLNLWTFSFGNRLPGTLPLSFFVAFFTSSLGGKKQRFKKNVGEKNVNKTWGCPFLTWTSSNKLLELISYRVCVGLLEILSGFFISDFQKGTDSKGKMDQMGRKLEITTNRTVFSQRIELQPVARYVWGFEIVQYHIILRSSRVHWAIGALRRSSSPCPFSTPCHKTKKKSYITLRFFSSTQDNQGHNWFQPPQKQKNWRVNSQKSVKKPWGYMLSYGVDLDIFVQLYAVWLVLLPGLGPLKYLRRLGGGKQVGKRWRY